MPERVREPVPVGPLGFGRVLVPLENGPLDVAAGVDAGTVPMDVLVPLADPELRQPVPTQLELRVKVSPSITVTNEELTSNIEQVLLAQFAVMMSKLFTSRFVGFEFAAAASLPVGWEVMVGRSWQGEPWALPILATHSEGG